MIFGRLSRSAKHQFTAQQRRFFGAQLEKDWYTNKKMLSYIKSSKPHAKQTIFAKTLGATCMFWMSYMVYENFTHVANIDYHWDHVKLPYEEKNTEKHH